MHPYGPHIFHTNSAEVYPYLSRWTAWRPCQHRVLASIDGRLPYRSLHFEHRTVPQGRVRPVGTVNHPNHQAFTQVTEFKHLTGQQHPHTSVVYEYPCDDGNPHDPVPRPENATLYRRDEAGAA